ncbi:MAG: type II toxin-antitoxin system VapC family toxin [Candidatus Thermoplasmatota archaeon]|nr:type II toxin-antitoxin system VapC family toxin [Candidatus Thermoplasmatota archaeon]
MTVTFDSSAWIEYFAGTQKGKLVEKMLNQNQPILTPSICLMEIKHKYLREEHPFKDRLDFICSTSTIVDITKDIALIAADIKKQYKLYTIDAVIYATAQKHKSLLLTGDHHFAELPNVNLI